MKNIFKITIGFAASILISSCSNEIENIASSKGFQLQQDATIVSPTILLEENESLIYGRFLWERSNNGLPTESTYSIVISDHDLDPDYSDAVETVIGVSPEPDARTCSLTVGQFNNLINSLPTFNCNQMNIDIRIKSKLGVSTNSLFQYSNPITLSVTGYSIKLPIIAFVKDGNAPEEEPRIAASSRASNTDYEGYMYLETGTYKLYQPDACYDFTTPTIYGGTAGIINTGSSTTGISITTAGHYVVKVNLANNTYTIKNFTTFGIFGPATRSGLGFANQIPFDYDTTTKIWSLQVSLINGKKFKFKSNLWSGALVVPSLPNPPYAPNTGSSITILGKTTTPTPLSLQENSVSGSGDITVPGTDDGTRDTYRIELDIRNPRDYKYIITKI
jgi:hypothetical protein